MAAFPPLNFEREPVDVTDEDLAALGALAEAGPSFEEGMVELENGDTLFLDPVEEAAVPEFGDNLAAFMPIHERQALATTLIDLIEADIEARKRRDEQYEEAIKRTGLAGEDAAPGGASFAGANKVVHPVIAESCVDYEAMVIKELFPSDGPVRTKVVGTPTAEKMDKAARKASYMNWQLTSQCKEYVGELEQLHTQLPLGGSQYLKVFWDVNYARPRFEFFPVDDTFLPASAGQWHTARRKTLRMYLPGGEVRDRVRSGLYIDAQEHTSSVPERSGASDATALVEGVDKDGENRDGVGVFFETYAFLSIPGFDDGDTVPYIVTIDKEAADIVAIYRNWDEADPHREEIPWVVEWQFIPWRGAQGIGLWHLIGGLSTAATGALRALLDSAHINNAATLLKLKGARVSGQSKQIQVGQTSDVEGPAGTTDPDIRKLFMPMPYNPPSPVLFELLGWLTNAAKGVVSTAEEKIAEASNNMPVGTAQALIEQGSKVFSAIHARQHRSQAEVLSIVHRLNGRYLDDQVTVAELGELVVTRADFEGPMDVIPVSDPAIFSETQRYSQVQALLSASMADVAAGLGQLWDHRAIRKRMLSTLKVAEPDELLPPPPQPQPTGAVSENIAMLTGGPAQAFPDQDHLAHIEVHARAMLDPMLGGNPIFAQGFVPAAAQHIAHHVALFYQAIMTQVASQAVGALPPGAPPPPDMEARVSAAQAQAAPQVHQAIGQALQFLPRVIQDGLAAFEAAKKVTQVIQPPQPVDPGAVDMAEVDRRRERDTQEMALKQEQIRQDAEQDDQDNEVKVRMNTDDNLTDLEIALGRHGFNPGMPQ